MRKELLSSWIATYVVIDATRFNLKAIVMIHWEWLSCWRFRISVWLLLRSLLYVCANTHVRCMMYLFVCMCVRAGFVYKRKLKAVKGSKAPHMTGWKTRFFTLKGPKIVYSSRPEDKPKVILLILSYHSQLLIWFVLSLFRYGGREKSTWLRQLCDGWIRMNVINRFHSKCVRLTAGKHLLLCDNNMIVTILCLGCYSSCFSWLLLLLLLLCFQTLARCIFCSLFSL